MEASEYFDRLRQRQLTVVADDDRLLAPLRRREFDASRFDEVDLTVAYERPIFAVVTRFPTMEELMRRWTTTPTAIAHLAAARYDNTPATIERAVDRLLSIDAPATLRQRAHYYDDIVSCGGLEARTGAGSLHCHLGEELELPNYESVLQVPWLYSVAEFFEASMVNLEAERSSFWVEGQLAFDGMIYLCNSDALKQRFAGPLAELVRRAAAGDNHVELVDNRVTRLVVGGTDVTEMLRGLVGDRERGAAVTELGLGCAQAAQPPDWGSNVLLNKSTPGLYIGIGAGEQLPHVDFIAAGATCHFADPASPA